MFPAFIILINILYLNSLALWVHRFRLREIRGRKKYLQDGCTCKSETTSSDSLILSSSSYHHNHHILLWFQIRWRVWVYGSSLGFLGARHLFFGLSSPPLDHVWSSKSPNVIIISCFFLSCHIHRWQLLYLATPSWVFGERAAGESDFKRYFKGCF